MSNTEVEQLTPGGDDTHRGMNNTDNTNTTSGETGSNGGEQAHQEHGSGGSGDENLPGQPIDEKDIEGAKIDELDRSKSTSQTRKTGLMFDDDLVGNTKPMTKKGSTYSLNGSSNNLNSGASVLGAIFKRGSKKRGGDGGEDDDAEKGTGRGDSELNQSGPTSASLAASRTSSVAEGSPTASLRVENTVDKAAIMEEKQKKLKAALLASRVALKKVQRVFDHAEKLTNDAFAAAMVGREHPEPVVRAFVDEYQKVCVAHHEKCTPPNLASRWRRMCDDYRSLRFDLHGVAEHVKGLAVDSSGMVEEVYQMAKPLALLWIQKDLGERGETLEICSERSIVDKNSGLVLQRWPNAEAPKRWVKSLNRFLNTPLNSFQVPMTVLFELCGHSFTAATMVPIGKKVKHPTLSSPWIKFHIQAAICNHHFPLEDDRAKADSTFVLGCDANLYCLNALGLMPYDLSDQFLSDYEGPLNEKDSIKKQTTSSTDRACTDLIALSRANVPKVNSILHKFGLKLQHVHMVHGALSQAEAVREATAGVGEDPNLSAALRSVVTELLSRVLKLVLREEFKKIEPTDEDTMATKMGALASQLVFSQIIEDVEHTTNGQLYKTTLKHSYKMFPAFGVPKKALWNESFVSESQIAQRIAALTGLVVVKGVIVGLQTGRLVRATKFPVDNSRLAPVRAKQRDLMQKLVSRIKSARKHSPHNAPFLTLQLADLFHQTTGRSNVSGSPRAIYEQLKGQDDNPFMTQIETVTQYCLVQQQLHLTAAKFTGDTTLLSERFRGFIEYIHGLTANSPDDPYTPYLIGLKVQTLLNFSRNFPMQIQLIQAQEATISGLQNLVRHNQVHPQQGYWLWENTFEGMTACLLSTKPHQATERGHQRLEHAVSTFGAQSVPVAAAYNDIAATLVHCNDLIGAEEAFHSAFDLFVRLNDESQTVFTTANNLGYTYFRMADDLMPSKLKKQRYGLLRFVLPDDVIVHLDKAADMFTYVIDNESRTDPKCCADALNNLGSVYLYRGQYWLSVDTITKSLVLTRGILSDDHPDRAGALHNLKMAEKRMKNNASLFIACWYKRFQAKKRLRLMRDGAKYAATFQRIGRAFFIRVQLYWLAEKKRMKRNVKNDMNDWNKNDNTADSNNAQKASLMQDLNFDDDDEDDDDVDAPPAVSSNQKKKNSGVGFDDSDDEGLDGRQMTKEGGRGGAEVVTPEVAEMLQRIGRGTLTRAMLTKLANIRSSRKPKKK